MRSHYIEPEYQNMCDIVAKKLEINFYITTNGILIIYFLMSSDATSVLAQMRITILFEIIKSFFFFELCNREFTTDDGNH